MSRADLLVLHAAECSGEAGRLARAIARHWPHAGQEPSITTGLIGGPHDRPGAPTVYVLGPDGAAAHESELNAAWRSRRPAVVLSPRIGGAERALRAGGVVVDALDLPPAVLAGAVYALLARQPVIDELMSDVRVATASSGGVAGEIERLQEEMQLASCVQRDLLPRRLPSIDGVEVGVLFRPVGYVSGDIYDAELIDDRYLAFFVADAVGHGVPAALMTMVISQALRRLERRQDGGRMMPPADVLRCLNAELVRRQDHAQRFATGVYGVLDTHAMDLRIASAGHPAPLLLTRSAGGNSCEALNAGGPLLGIFDDAEFDELEIRLRPGQTLLVYSDGFEVAFPRVGAKGGASRLPSDAYLAHLAELAGHEQDSLGDALHRLERVLDAQAGSLRQADDITALAISIGATERAARSPAPIARAA